MGLQTFAQHSTSKRFWIELFVLHIVLRMTGTSIIDLSSFSTVPQFTFCSYTHTGTYVHTMCNWLSQSNSYCQRPCIQITVFKHTHNVFSLSFFLKISNSDTYQYVKCKLRDVSHLCPALLRSLKGLGNLDNLMFKMRTQDHQTDYSRHL